MENNNENIIKSLPGKPGIYQFLDAEGKIIYVGKAKDLKKRVSSYFRKDKQVGKTAVLVKKIADIKFILVETELDALLLENNLIKKYQPKYNIQLKDDKTYPWICVKNERFPRVFPTRNLIRDGSFYFGPYSSVRMMYTVLDLLKQLYKLRNCGYNLSEENISKNKFKVCLEYHLGNCKAPCEGKQAEEDYNNTITEIREILKGNISMVVKHLKEKMREFSELYDYENAHLIKEKIDLLEHYQSKSTVVSPTIENVDVFSICQDESTAYVNYLKVVNGAIIQGHTIELKKKLDESPEELLEFSIGELRQRYSSDAKEVIVPFKPGIELPGITFTVPQRGDKKNLLELSEKNAKYYKLDKQKQETLIDPERHTKRILEQMKKDLRLSELPYHIECFDNSNIQGAYPVAACVVFKNARASKKDYRHYNIKTVEGPDDFASMAEVVYRTYSKLLNENEPLPQLIIVDGGKGQLSAGLKSLEVLGLRGKISIIGIAKRLEEIYYPGDPLPMYLDKRSETLKIIQQLRNEAHRFGITHHRGRRSKGTIKTELTEIKGISNITAEKLLLHFKSVKRIKEATEQEIQAIVGKAKARVIIDFFSGIKTIK
ncbi:MAG: excinuclease ABC subunit UvrC [Bacteroidetes bacterium]|nr:excinuclease ABC subunit UvrC [Bacteroidota bacterium]